MGAGPVITARQGDSARREGMLRSRVVGEVAEERAVRAGEVVQYPAGVGGGDFRSASCPPGYLAVRAVLSCGSRQALGVLRPRLLRTVRAVRTRLRMCSLSALHLAALSLLSILGSYHVHGLLSRELAMGSLAVREFRACAPSPLC